MKVYQDRAGVIDHLEELRRRLIICLVVVVLSALGSFYFVEDILGFIIRPVGELVFIAPHEAFLSYIKIALVTGGVLSAPVILFQFWRFLAAGLKYKEKKALLIYLPGSILLFALGVCFAWRLILPIGIKFLMSFGTASVRPMISLGSYISFAGIMILIFGVVFELPLVIIFLTRISLITPGLLREKRKYIIFVIFVVAAVFTPPDVVTQVLMAVPLILLYELGIWTSVLFRKR